MTNFIDDLTRELRVMQGGNMITPQQRRKAHEWIFKNEDEIAEISNLGVTDCVDLILQLSR